MSTVDIIILLLTIVIVCAIVFFSFILPKIKNKKTGCGCNTCPIGNDRKAKRIIKNIKNNSKQDK